MNPLVALGTLGLLAWGLADLVLLPTRRALRLGIAPAWQPTVRVAGRRARAAQLGLPDLRRRADGGSRPSLILRHMASAPVFVSVVVPLYNEAEQRRGSPPRADGEPGRAWAGPSRSCSWTTARATGPPRRCWTSRRAIPACARSCSGATSGRRRPSRPASTTPGARSW